MSQSTFVGCGPPKTWYEPALCTTSRNTQSTFLSYGNCKREKWKHTTRETAACNSIAWRFHLMMRPFLCRPVSRQMCVRVISANSNSFVTVKKEGLSYGASKPNIENACEGLNTHQSRMGNTSGCNFISHLPLFILFLVFFNEKGSLVHGSEQWNGPLGLKWR